MKIATMQCRDCGGSWRALYPQELTIFVCPFCGDVCGEPSDAETINGMCATCGKPLDDHGWDGDVPEVCPRATSSAQNDA